jgi:hypothetical protein
VRLQRERVHGTMRRGRFFFNLGAMCAAVVLIVASVAFAGQTVKAIGLGMGIAGALASSWFTAAAIHERQLDGHLNVGLFRRRVGLWTLLAAALAAVAAWEAIQSAVFPADPAKWLTLANGLLVATLACAGLIAHELCTERVVHLLQVVDAPRERH